MLEDIRMYQKTSDVRLRRVTIARGKPLQVKHLRGLKNSEKMNIRIRFCLMIINSKLSEARECSKKMLVKKMIESTLSIIYFIIKLTQSIRRVWNTPEKLRVHLARIITHHPQVSLCGHVLLETCEYLPYWLFLIGNSSLQASNRISLSLSEYSPPLDIL